MSDVLSVPSSTAPAADASVCAIIVSFNPDRPTLLALIARLRAQVAHLVVIDNASSVDVAAFLDGSGADFVQNSSNLGLGSGFNLGIEWARQRRASHVILFDQDSLPQEDMVRRLLDGAARLQHLGVALAAVGPRFIDVKTGLRSVVIGPERLYTRKKVQSDLAGCSEAGYLISSGKLIAMTALAAVGPMRADLFIDAIDIEWCLRARSRRLRCFVVDDARMDHDIGDRMVQIGTGAKVLHGPERHYYIIRNALLLMQSPEIPWQWKLLDILKTLRRLLAYPLLSPQPWQHIKWMARGVKDGLAGKSGKAQYRK
jgi:rhamnosyltransferase